MIGDKPQHSKFLVHCSIFNYFYCHHLLFLPKKIFWLDSLCVCNHLSLKLKTMKLLFILIYIFFSLTSVCQIQNPYKKYLVEDMKGFRKWSDPIPIDKGQEKMYFQYATLLYKQDSLQKAGQIFDRIYWLDTASRIGMQALIYRTKIENKIDDETRQGLLGTWDWSNCPSETDNKKSTMERKNKKIVFQKDQIIFYENDSIRRRTAYQLTQIFDWVDGFLHNCIKYKDSNEEWLYDIRQLDAFVSDDLKVILKSSIGHIEYVECYKRE